MPDEIQPPPAPNPERKTLDDRAKMTELERIRHSCAHVLATAILRLWPDAQFAYGPPVENGFYYDLECSHRISPEDFAKLEEEMKKEIKANNVFEKLTVTREQAIADAQSGRLGGLAERPGNASKFKLDLLKNIPEGEPISYYKNGDFIDLCAGPHVMRTGNIGAFKLTTVAAAYYKGDEKGPQLQRIYGTAFKNKTALEEWLKLQEEAKRRDHRKIGAEMNLFAFDADFTGPGLPLWLPKGGAILEELEKLAKETEFQAGYVRVKTPHLAREKMYKTSGHLPYYAESMFPPMELQGEGEFGVKVQKFKQGAAEDDRLIREVLEGLIDLKSPPVGEEKSWGDALQRVVKSASPETQKSVETFVYDRLSLSLFSAHFPQPDRYYLKAMNCPHHHRIFAAEPRSYRDLPLRLAEYGTCYRYEQSGELFGLMRVRSMNMNDAHIYCTPEQFADEFRAVNEMYLKYFQIFGLGKYQMRFSTSSPEGLGKKYVNEPELWKQTEDMVRRVLVESGINFVEVPNEAAFYGPKIDVQVWSAIGREFTIATNQVDFAVPAKFGLTYRDRDNTDKTPLCIHRAPLGTHERFIGFLIEHYAGNFPLWLAPDQVRVITLGDDAPLLAAGKALVHELRQNFVRVTGDFTNEPIKAKIANAEHARVHTMLVLGPRDLEAGNVSVRLHTGGPQGAKPTAQVVAEIVQSIKERRA
ncbi:MAG: threonyl-tRNA synthetase [Limisphaerales bacterium]|nr:MAG: threonyl-tRNA synthetase [Limisphaerales bacterium]KAG0510739.1 MAG: threonyl-tRNA synthetase [Limisphaerales bacterium]TXT52635.1 MAG: threonyl-tRNA synthetase [Limisphaerales bacterium]